MTELQQRMNELAENLKSPYQKQSELLLKTLKDVINDLELRAKIRANLNDDDEFVVELSDSIYQKSKDVIESLK